MVVHCRGGVGGGWTVVRGCGTLVVVGRSGGSLAWSRSEAELDYQTAGISSHKHTRKEFIIFLCLYGIITRKNFFP